MAKGDFKNPNEYFQTKDAMKYNVLIIYLRNVNFIHCFQNALSQINQILAKLKKLNIKKVLRNQLSLKSLDNFKKTFIYLNGNYIQCIQKL